MVSKLGDPNFLIMRKQIHDLLENPSLANEPWTVQGLGMMRTKLTRELRLHIWDAEAAYAGSSDIHTHPWDFASIIFNGTVWNTRYVESAIARSSIFVPYNKQEIICGPNACQMGTPERVFLCPDDPVETYNIGDTYQQLKHEIHRSKSSAGAVTVIHREPNEGEDRANVFWPRDEKWTDAAPRKATEQEIKKFTRLALAYWDDIA